jgi:cytidylate kinase
MIITIDGPAGTGKSTVAREVAHALSYALLDTGALYRAVAYALIVYKVALSNEQAIAAFLDSNPLDILCQGDDVRYVIAGIDVTPHLRTRETSNAASLISTYTAVRSFLLPIQRSFAFHQNVVCEGRDMGTTVFPNAEVKIFLTAHPEIRANRRFLETQKKSPATFEEVQKELSERDHRDSTRTISPLAQPHDAVVIDTSYLTIQQVVAKILDIAKAVPHWEHFLHQADIGIRGIGTTVAEAFAQAALAITAVITDPSSVTPKNSITITTSAEDLDTLLFDFLNLIIYEMDTRKMLFSQFDITVTGLRLKATLTGEPVSPSKHHPAVEVKAATYYELLVCHQPNGAWCAQCVVDV